MKINKKVHRPVTKTENYLCMFSPCMRGFTQGTPASSYSPKKRFVGELVTLKCPQV